MNTTTLQRDSKFDPAVRLSQSGRAAQRDSDYDPAIRLNQSGCDAQDVAYHGPGECTPERRSRISCYARRPSRTGPRSGRVRA